MKRALVALLVAVNVLGTAQVARAEWSPPHRDPVCHADTWKSHRIGPCGWKNVPALIGRVFGSHAAVARCVAWKESRFYPRARNGQYRGLWQFGASWYVGRFNPENPVVATLRAWAATHGTDWTHWAWECGR